MSTEKNKQLSRRWFEEVWNRRRDEAIDELFAADGIAHGLEPMELAALPGPEPFRVFWKRFCGAFPDLYVTVEDVIAEGEKTAVRISFRGTHRGDHLGVPATGKPMTSTAMTLIHWRNGQVIEAWNEFDALGIFLQAGVVEARV
jgi:steroid delta-isomerase-like uncharacterized protein